MLLKRFSLALLATLSVVLLLAACGTDARAYGGASVQAAGDREGRADAEAYRDPNSRTRGAYRETVQLASGDDYRPEQELYGYD